MPYPQLPYPGYHWSMNHHMGVTDQVTLQQLLWAANAFGGNPDPIYDINNYLTSNEILTNNVRVDSGQPDPWRDYQQILSELGLIVSTRISRQITLTAIGLAYLEETLSYPELMTLQALRYQFPNGHKTQISPKQRKELRGTPFKDAHSMTEVQLQTDIRIRPTVLAWKILRELAKRNYSPVLSSKEVETFLVPCIRHRDTQSALEAIIQARDNKTLLRSASRQTQEWFRFFLMTPLFKKAGQGIVTISDFALQKPEEIDVICSRLEDDETFWMPKSHHDINLLSWYLDYGSIDLSINLIDASELDETQYLEGNLERDEPTIATSSINLRAFSKENLIGNEPPETPNTLLNITYDRQNSIRQYVLHDQMIEIIANVATSNGGEVFDDPRSLDLLIRFRSHEFLVEVKSVNPRTFANRLRLALGQLLHYDYLRSLDSNQPRRKVVAFPAVIRSSNWAIPFIRDFMDFDLLSLSENTLQLQSSFPLSQALFETRKQMTLPNSL